MRKPGSTTTGVRDIEIGALVDYVTKHGWKRIQHPNDSLIVFEGPEDDEGNPIQLILPTQRDFQDSYLRLTEAINLISVIEERSAHDVIRSIQDKSLALSGSLQGSMANSWLAEMWKEQRETLKALTGHVMAFMLLIGSLVFFHRVFELLAPQYKDILQRIDYYGIAVSLFVFGFSFLYRVVDSARKKTRATRQLKHQMERILSEEVKLSRTQIDAYVEQELYRIGREAKQIHAVGS